MIKRPFHLVVFILVSIVFAIVSATPGECNPGTPGSSEFGIGGSIFPDGPFFLQGLNLAGNLHLNWILVNFSIAENFPQYSSIPDWSKLDEVVLFANQNQISIILSIVDPVEWILTPEGPDPGRVEKIIDQISQRYNGQIAALELFPGANTFKGWGANPNPEAYSNLFVSTSKYLKTNELSMILVGGGLKPVGNESSPSEVDDLTYLQTLYDYGIADYLQVISIDLSDLTGDPLTPSNGKEHRILRHYEEIRRIMINNNHSSEKLWVTRLKAPSGKINPSDADYFTPDMQATWMDQAYLQLRSQLYIGVGIFNGINPSNTNSEGQNIALITDETNFHPLYYKLRSFVANNSLGGLAMKRGKAKTIALAKTQPRE